MVVGAPDINEFAETALEFVAMVSDIRGKVGELTVALDHRPVFVVSERGGLEPFGAIFGIQQAPVAQ